MSVRAIDLQYSPSALCVDVLTGRTALQQAPRENTLDQWAAFDPHDSHGKHIVISGPDGSKMAVARYLDEKIAAQVGSFSLTNRFDITLLKGVIGCMAEVNVSSLALCTDVAGVAELLMNQVFALAARDQVDSVLLTVPLDINSPESEYALPDIKPHLVRDYMRCFPKMGFKKSVSGSYSGSREVGLIDHLIEQRNARFCSKPHWHHLSQKLEYCLLVPVSKPVI